MTSTSLNGILLDRPNTARYNSRIPLNDSRQLFGDGSHQNEPPMSGQRRIENDMAEAPDGNQKRHLVLIRHGESELNVINRSRRVFCGQFDTPLTAHGREQAQLAGRLVAANPELRIRHAVSASLQRARETLDLILPELTNGVQLLPIRTELNERSLGLFEGQNEEDVFLAFPHYRDDVKFNRFGCDFIQKAPGGENLTDVSDRAWQCIQGLWQAVDGDLLIVSHHITMRCILGRALHLTQQQTIDLRIPNALPIILRQNDLGDFVACDAILTK